MEELNFEVGAKLLERINSLNSLALSDTSAMVCCGPTTFLFSERADLITISGFFEAMLELKPSKMEAGIDLRIFCKNETALTSLIQYANLHGVVPIQWSIRTIAEMIFLVDPLQLSSCIQYHIYTNIITIQKNQANFDQFLVALNEIITRDDPSEHEIAKIHAMLVEMQDVASIIPTDDCSSMSILAIWMKRMSTTMVFAELVHLQNEIDICVGDEIPSLLKSCDEAVPGLLFWITMVHSCGKAKSREKG